MIKRYAVIKDNVIQNICLWDGQTDWSPSIEGAIVVEAQDNWRILGTFINNVYQDPVE